MREIKFRAKIKAHDFEQKLALINKPQNEGEWAYGEIHVNSKIPHIHVGPYRYPIDIETIGQYTGLKDANGKDLYEGDIIRGFGGVMHHVKYEETAFRCFLKGERYGFCISQEWLTELEKVIIGNIHEYPKTYEECENILGLEDSIIEGCLGYEYKLLNAFQKLLMCRDAYWKIAGEEMGLEMPWEPDWLDDDVIKYIISHDGKRFGTRGGLNYINYILAFPTEEMRDYFYENFKELIEICKELL